MMDSRERVRLALDHQEADRVPIDLGGTLCTALHREAYVALKRHLGLEVEELVMADPIQQIPYHDGAVQDRFGADVRIVLPPAATVPAADVQLEGDYFVMRDEWGGRLHMPHDGGLYFDWVDFPLKQASLEALDAFRWPRLPSPADVALLARQASTLRRETTFALTGSGILGGGIFEQPPSLMGYEDFLVALVQAPAFADRLLESITELYIQACDQYLDQVGEHLDVFTYWDDICGQTGWLVSPRLYRQMIKPKQRRLVEAVKRRTAARFFYHGCGAVFDLIPDLIEIGVDIINPVQVSAQNMDTRRLKQEFGQDVVFWGGGVDSQSVLPFGTPAQVADEVKRRIDDLAPGGGYVFAPIHNIQAQVPPENIVAMFDTALEYGRY